MPNYRSRSQDVALARSRNYLKFALILGITMALLVAAAVVRIVQDDAEIQGYKDRQVIAEREIQRLTTENQELRANIRSLAEQLLSQPTVVIPSLPFPEILVVPVPATPATTTTEPTQPSPTEPSPTTPPTAPPTTPPCIRLPPPLEELCV